VSLIDADGEPLADDHDSSRWYREARAEPSRSGSLARALHRHNFAVTTSNFFFHKELWRRLGGFAPYRYVHDYDFVLRALALCADRVVYAEAMESVRYRVHGDNTILEDVPRALEERAAMLRSVRSPARRWKALRTRARDASGVSRAVAATDDPLPPPGRDTAGVGRALETAAIPLGLVTRSLDYGGLEEMVALLAKTLPERGFDVRVLCTHSGGAVADRLVAGGVHVTVGGGRPEAWRGWAAEGNPRVLSTHFVDVEVVEVLGERGVPIYETVQNCYAWFTRADWARECRKRALLTGTVAVSELVALYYARFTETVPTPHVIPNGVHLARTAAVPRAWARDRLGLAPEAPVLAHLGRVTLQKNIVGLLDAFRIVLEREPAAHLVLAGSQNDRAYVRAVRRKHGALLRSGSVRLSPPVPYVGTVLSAADAYVSNSFFEGWSIAASEAAWTGLPLVLSDCGSARELVGDGGERGWVVPNPLGDPLEVTWERLEARTPAALKANEDALAQALLDTLAARRDWAARRQEILRRTRATVAPDEVSGAYARLLGSAVTP
jgi:glycosyltransferase involved in cell wall biosynthesis